jgi:hypothetical protein
MTFLLQTGETDGCLLCPLVHCTPAPPSYDPLKNASQIAAAPSRISTLTPPVDWIRAARFNFSKIQALDVFTGLTSLGICQQVASTSETTTLHLHSRVTFHRPEYARRVGHPSM